LLSTTKIKDSIGEKGNKYMIEQLSKRMKYTGLAILDVSFVSVNTGPFPTGFDAMMSMMGKKK
jgi:hypothetical protein